ncbi:hypothetical protein LQ51_20125 [Micromonospora sp. HK10]|nr:hypothetical protein LQ51_20125 [Micromonospora sp. HK10]
MAGERVGPGRGHRGAGGHRQAGRPVGQLGRRGPEALGLRAAPRRQLGPLGGTGCRGTVSLARRGDTVSLARRSGTISLAGRGDTISLARRGDTISLARRGDTISLARRGDTISLARRGGTVSGAGSTGTVGGPLGIRGVRTHRVILSGERPPRGRGGGAGAGGGVPGGKRRGLRQVVASGGTDTPTCRNRS